MMTKTTYDKVPAWGQNIITHCTAMADSAYEYRRMAVAYRSAMHDVLGTDKAGFAIYDKIDVLAKKNLEFLAKIDKEKSAEFHSRIERDVRNGIRKMKEAQEKAKNEKKNKKGAK